MISFCELAGTRTQGPYIKSVLLYQLSYQFKTFCFFLDCKDKENEFKTSAKKMIFYTKK
jgi:hypothetical protein